MTASRKDCTCPHPVPTFGPEHANPVLWAVLKVLNEARDRGVTEGSRSVRGR
jgi:hypothetical protein